MLITIENSIDFYHDMIYAHVQVIAAHSRSKLGKKVNVKCMCEYFALEWRGLDPSWSYLNIGNCEYTQL